MIGKVCQRGGDTRRLLYYLFTEGQVGERGLSSEHSDAHVIGGFADPHRLQPARSAQGRFSVGRLAALLDAPVRAAGVPATSKPVYHLAISAAPGDRQLTDAEWGDVAAEYLERLGLASRSSGEGAADGAAGVRWVAVRHAPDHIHVVATLVSEQGLRVWPRNDFYRAREASLAVESRYGLTTTSAAGRTADRETTRPERRRHDEQNQRRAAAGLPGRAGPDRDVLRGKVRAAAAGAASFEEMSERLSLDGVLVRPRMSTQDPTQVTGFAVALRPRGEDAAAGREPIWFGGGKLAPDLTYPQLQRRWQDPRADPVANDRGQTAAGTRPSDAAAARAADLERRRLWITATSAVAAAEEQLRVAVTSGDTSAIAEADAAARAAGEVLAALSALAERHQIGPLRQAAEAYDRASRTQRRQATPHTGLSRRNRQAARGLRALRLVRPADRTRALQLLESVHRLCLALADLREAQALAAQAAAARRAAELLTVTPAVLRPMPTRTTGRRRTAAAAATGSPVQQPLWPAADHRPDPPTTTPRGPSQR